MRGKELEAWRHGVAAVTRARRLLRTLDLVQLDDDLLDVAATLSRDGLRSLDAIHLAAVHVLGDDVAAVITYDQRMSDAPAALGWTTTAPR